ncbi:LacI family transcriptional regulator [Massilia norwichensis]|uniref:LacI family transcriptional regulator n=1 Tax=Massilia norwichensis TaxID=1442366 RepID=A0ABT2A1Z5_9BURK|nr:LacI family DNA-binding transcriptional regulator [Massilia norwichensis]MCS0588221.1 LacI family transcriptional regulator [Massilia norwichensis]
MKQVAERAGVSTSTVSHVINNTRVVSEDVRQRVLAIIEEMRYIPSAVARSLKNDRTQTIGMMVPNNSNPYFAELIQGIEDAAFKVGYNVILCNAYEDPKKQAAYLRVLIEKRIDGLILVASSADQELARLLRALAVPIVLVDREVDGVPADFIKADHEEGGYLATRHLIELGHRDIACISGPADLLSSRDRVRGYLRALREAGLRFRLDYLVRSNFTGEGGYRALQRLLRLPKRPSAVFASNDLSAIGSLCAASEAGLRIPDDLSVIGYDDIALASYTTPRLTTVAQPKYEMGQRITNVLIERIMGGHLPTRRELLQTRLVVRQSTATHA